MLYKFLPPKGAKDSLSNLTIKLSPPNQLNDPFEFMPGGYTGDTQDERFKRGMELLKTDKYRQYWNSKKGTNLSNEDWISFLKNLPSAEIFALVNSVFDRLQARDWSTFIDKISQSFGLASFSEKNDNILMWSHYAHSHQGVVIGYDLHEFSDKLHKVKYTADRIKLPLSSTCDSEDERKEIMLSVMKSKSKDWHYEDEWRLISRLPPISDNNLYLLKIEPSLIRSVYFGIKTSNEDQREILSLVSKLPNCEEIQIYEMVPTKESFALFSRRYMRVET